MHYATLWRIGLYAVLSSMIGYGGWTIQQSGTTITLWDIDFVDANHGWVVGGYPYSENGIILKTSDGGDTWINQTPIIPDGIDYLSGVSFVDTLTGWVVGKDTLVCSLILKTTDGGQAWIRQHTPIDTPSVWSVHFLDENNGWMSHGGPYGPAFQQVVLHTTDGGNSYMIQGWTNYDGGTYKIFFSDLQHGWVTGGTEELPTPRGYIMQTADAGATWDESYCWNASDPFALPSMTGISFPMDNLHGWACGWDNYSTRIIHTVNSGGNWTIQLNSNSLSPIEDIHFVDLQNGWTVGWDGQILRTTNSGNDWYSEPSGISLNLHGVDFVDLNNGWAVGASGIILKYSGVEITEEMSSMVMQFKLLSLFTRRNEIIFSLSSSGPDNIILSLFNIIGQKLLSKKINISPGISRHNLLLLQDLSCGTYFLKIEATDKSIIKKFVLVN